MSRLPILIAPDPGLKTPCRPVVAVDDRLRTLAADMLETMYAAPGIGLAAPQVGVLERVFVMDTAGRNEAPRPTTLINPEILWTADERSVHEEGCLSLPEHYAEVERPAAVTVRYLDLDGGIHEVRAEGLDAVCMQHEIDHLDGVLFVDHLSALKRNMILRKLIKQKRQKD